MTALLGMSENNRNLPSLIQTGPSHHSKPSPMTSIAASLGTSLSKAGSRRSMLPTVRGCLSSAAADLRFVVGIKIKAKQNGARKQLERGRIVVHPQ
jgi:hypothetical protein